MYRSGRNPTNTICYTHIGNYLGPSFKDSIAKVENVDEKKIIQKKFVVYKKLTSLTPSTILYSNPWKQKA